MPSLKSFKKRREIYSLTNIKNATRAGSKAIADSEGIQSRPSSSLWSPGVAVLRHRVSRRPGGVWDPEPHQEVHREEVPVDLVPPVAPGRIPYPPPPLLGSLLTAPASGAVA